VNHANLQGFLNWRTISPRDTDRNIDYDPIHHFISECTPRPAVARMGVDATRPSRRKAEFSQSDLPT
jgi:hypothetical protein